MPVGIGMRDRASSFGRNQSVEITWPKKSTKEAPILDLFGESILRRSHAKKGSQLLLRNIRGSRPSRLRHQDTFGFSRGQLKGVI